MAMTIASLHLIAVVVVAFITKSKLLTWLAALGVLYIAFAVGSSTYGLMDAISTLIGLGMGLQLIDEKPAPPEQAPRVAPTPAPLSAKQAPLQVPARTQIGLAKDFELHPTPRRRIGRWVTLILSVLIAVWVCYS